LSSFNPSGKVMPCGKKLSPVDFFIRLRRSYRSAQAV
jgi:hypothetical protein